MEDLTLETLERYMLRIARCSRAFSAVADRRAPEVPRLADQLVTAMMDARAAGFPFWMIEAATEAGKRVSEHDEDSPE